MQVGQQEGILSAELVHHKFDRYTEHVLQQQIGHSLRITLHQMLHLVAERLDQAVLFDQIEDLLVVAHRQVVGQRLLVLAGVYVQFGERLEERRVRCVDAQRRLHRADQLLYVVHSRRPLADDLQEPVRVVLEKIVQHYFADLRCEREPLVDRYVRLEQFELSLLQELQDELFPTGAIESQVTSALLGCFPQTSVRVLLDQMLQVELADDRSVVLLQLFARANVAQSLLELLLADQPLDVIVLLLRLRDHHVLRRNDEVQIVLEQILELVVGEHVALEALDRHEIVRYFDRVFDQRMVHLDARLTAVRKAVLDVQADRDDVVAKRRYAADALLDLEQARYEHELSGQLLLEDLLQVALADLAQFDRVAPADQQLLVANPVEIAFVLQRVDRAVRVAANVGDDVLLFQIVDAHRFLVGPDDQLVSPADDVDRRVVREEHGRLVSV